MTPEESRLYKKINRQLAKEDEFKKLCKARGQRHISNVGEFYIIDIYTNTITHTHVNLKDWAE